MKIKIEKHAITREKGKEVRNKILAAWDESDEIIIEMSDETVAAPGFLDEAFAHLIFYKERDEINAKLKFVNMSSFDRALLRDINKFRRKDQDGKEGKAIDPITQQGKGRLCR